MGFTKPEWIEHNKQFSVPWSPNTFLTIGEGPHDVIRDTHKQLVWAANGSVCDTEFHTDTKLITGYVYVHENDTFEQSFGYMPPIVNVTSDSVIVTINEKAHGHEE